MKNGKWLLPLCLLVTAGAAQAQLYKWVGPDGKITYSDTPPPSTAKKVETKSLSGNSAVDTANLPFELAEAVRDNPVTLYSSTPCQACDEGRKLLNARGVPFVEKTVNSSDDIEQLKKASGDARLPFLAVGRNKHQGFQADAWNTLLSSAGYPESSRLPKTYRNPEAQPASPKPAEAPKKQDKKSEPEQTRPEALPEPIGNAPPGFHF